jgi:hypothetical protein
MAGGTTRGTLLEIGNYAVALRFDRVAVEISGTAVWRVTHESVVRMPESWVDSIGGSARQDVGYASASTALDLTPHSSPVDIVVRFGARIPTTSDESGLERDRTDFFATAALRYRTGPFAFAAENGVGIHGTIIPRYPQSDVWAYTFSAGYRDRGLFGSAQLVGHSDGKDRVQRGNEDLSELRIGAGIGNGRWLGITYIRGLTDFSPRHGLRVTAGLHLSSIF